MNMYENILSSLNTPIIVLDKENFIKFANPAFEEFISLSKNILINNTLKSFIDEDSPLFLLINRARKANNSLSEDNLTISSKNNLKKKSKINIFPVFNNSKYITIQFTESLVSDKFISHKINNKISKSFSSLIGMLMHELKNPLSGIVGASQLLEKDLKNDQDLELVELIRLEANRINKLLSNIELISAGEGYLPSDYVNIHEVLNHCKKVAKNSFGKRITFVDEYDPSLPEVYGNYDLLIQIFLNLIKNSCEAQNENGEIKLKTSFKSNKIVTFNSNDLPERMPLQIEVIDYGVGIKESELPNIFEPFVSTKNNNRGLGLSIVSSGLNSLGATIEVTSNNHKTNFCINFPLKVNLNGKDNEK